MKTLFLTLLLLTGYGFCHAQSTELEQEPVQTAPITVATAPEKITSLIKIDETIGTGPKARPGRRLDMHYTGWLYDPEAPNRHGLKFDSSHVHGQPLSFQLGARQVIRGWELGIEGMKVGGKRTLIIPGYLAYGAAGTSSIPPHASLIFDVELLKVQ